MTLIDALKALQDKGITELVGAVGETDIINYLYYAYQSDEEARRWSEQSWAKYHMEHADDYFIAKMNNGHYVIANNKDNSYNLPVYGTQASEGDMFADFEEWDILRQAQEIADEKVPDKNESEHCMWMTTAVYMLKEAKEKSMAEFSRMFPGSRGCTYDI